MSDKSLSNPEGALDEIPIITEQRPPHELRYELDKGASSLLIRKEGATIRRLQVNGVDVLTTGTDLGDNAMEQQPLKIDATHTMLPAGPNEIGPQHGLSRYLDYEVGHSTKSSVSLRARDPLRNLGHTKELELQPDGLEVTDRVESLGADTIGISVGEHLYFSVAEKNLPGIRFIDEDGSDTTIRGHREDGSEFVGNYSDTLADISIGETVFDENFPGTQLIEIPGIGRIRLTARLSKSEDNMPVYLFMWHRPGANTVCFEPVAGFNVGSDGMHNDRIVLEPGESLELQSKIQLV